MVARRLVVLIAAAAIVAVPTRAAELGDPAPPLQVVRWLKGPPMALEAGRGQNIYVVAFWRTTSPRSQAAIPTLSKLQEKYAGKNVVMVAISDEAAQTVETFVTKHGAEMNYRVALDARQASATAYLGGFGVQSLPHAFVVDMSGRVVWHGSSLTGLDETLEAIVTGKYDLEQTKRQFKFRRMLARYLQLTRSVTGGQEARKLGEQIYEFSKSDAEMVNALAWMILTQPGLITRDLELAMRAAQRAYDACEGQHAAIVDTYARALFETGQRKRALEFQQKAVELAKDDAELRQRLEKTLERYRKTVSGD
jgi:peroxiredoxin